MIKIHAHRGASMYAPENTLEAAELAIKMNADAIELDVHLTADKHIVVSHDGTLGRCCDGEGDINKQTLEQLQKYNFNNNNAKYQFCRIPTLNEFYDLVKPSNLFLNVEIKGDCGEIEPYLADLTKQFGMVERVLYSSFNHESLVKIKELEPNCKTGLLYGDTIPDIVNYCKKQGYDAIHPYHGELTSEIISECIANNIMVNPWTVDNTEDMKRLYSAGVTGIITDCPDVAREVLNSL
ncbi:MAG: glycerophosphodiester phosphodiesterase [Clostridiales bacterium]|nr:MAG: glycerophosphodiester phosphodiesterase [Clostridiales bacterium]